MGKRSSLISSSASELKVDSLLMYMDDELENIKNNPNNIMTNKNMDDFFFLYGNYLATKSKKIEWEKIKSPPDEKIVQYPGNIDHGGHQIFNNEAGNVSMTEDVKIKRRGLVSKLAVLKLNGGLGTSMGCIGPKSAIEIKGDDNFLDLCVKQIDVLQRTYDVEIPFILMNSFNTEEKTNRMLRRYKNIRTFSQSVFPRISANSFLPIDSSHGKASVYPPGHGDIFNSLKDSGMLDKLLKEGKEYLFVSNIDNLAATVDFNILNYVIENDVDFLMEVTNKTRADIKGGTLIEMDDKLSLLEIAQVPADKKNEFTSVRKFKIFNTNSVWINLKKLKSLLKEKKIVLDIIENKKTIKGIDEPVIQLETAMGAAIKYFPNAVGMIVPRSRFLPVKTCSDLFLIRSNLYIERDGFLSLSPRRMFNAPPPLIKLLGKMYKDIQSFDKMFKTIPDIVELDHLTVSGNITFGRNISLKGTVIIIADDESVINIPDGAILDDNILYGNLPIIEH
ncbi:UDP-glucose pyrophosphorylase [Pseudoloma neurophilia]|uniref:UTP--glucose-1-phosphate uridylyltransferase n=1 Tax=Pseudoloma neurophilia TaxID=146866 RepID=A0A0R0M3G1_9MICR|nr:UDP-glucose pyrophosphorylase [Pseudoloma neurophilia]